MKLIFPACSLHIANRKLVVCASFAKHYSYGPVLLLWIWHFIERFRNVCRFYLESFHTFKLLFEHWGKSGKLISAENIGRRQKIASFPSSENEEYRPVPPMRSPGAMRHIHASWSVNVARLLPISSSELSSCRCLFPVHS